MIHQKDGLLVYQFDGEKVCIQPWGPDAFRVRATKAHVMPSEAWALEEEPEQVRTDISFAEDGSASIRNRQAKAVVSKRGKITIYNADYIVVLEEYARNRRDLLDAKCSAIEVEARELKPLRGGDYHLTLRFESQLSDGKIFGMGQYQQPFLDLKGLDLELAHRKSQASVPFALSSLGYGILWNNPSIGRVVFEKTTTSFEAYSTNILDYWVVVGDTPADIVQRYTSVTGKPPMMPEHALGFWQCKLRYEAQEELLEVAREYRRRELPVDLIVIDFFHWPLQGEWKFDPQYWPHPDAMIQQLREWNIELTVSIWPTVNQRSSNFQEMLEHGFLVRTERGVRTNFEFEGSTVYYDPTNPGAREYVWNKAKQNYLSKGIKTFWLDQAEPEYSVYDFEDYRYFLGTNLSVGNIYPKEYARMFFEGQKGAGQKDIVNLLRCAWAGCQKYGALVWNGDIAYSWGSFRNQLAAGLNMGIAGLPWWTTDIRGFHGGNPNDEAFRELFVRWFQWGAFCPVMRLHGDREPKPGNLSSSSGAANEVWSDVLTRHAASHDEVASESRQPVASSRASQACAVPQPPGMTEMPFPTPDHAPERRAVETSWPIPQVTGGNDQSFRVNTCEVEYGMNSMDSFMHNEEFPEQSAGISAINWLSPQYYADFDWGIMSSVNDREAFAANLDGVQTVMNAYEAVRQGPWLNLLNSQPVQTRMPHFHQLRPDDGTPTPSTAAPGTSRDADEGTGLDHSVQAYDNLLHHISVEPFLRDRSATPLPSLAHARVYFRLYFQNFHPAYTFLQKSTDFYHDPANWPLLLAVCAVGSVYCRGETNLRFRDLLLQLLESAVRFYISAGALDNVLGSSQVFLASPAEDAIGLVIAQTSILWLIQNLHNGVSGDSYDLSFLIHRVQTASWKNGLINAVSVGTIIGAFANGYFTHRLGHRKVLLASLASIVAFIFISFSSPNLLVLLVGQFLCGIPWGVFATTAPAYASEVCPMALRGYLIVFVNLCWALGQLISAGVQAGFSDGSNQWSYRVPFAIKCVWPLPPFAILWFAPESPWHSVRLGDYEQAEKSVLRLGSASEAVNSKQKVAVMIHTNEIEQQMDEGTSYLDCFRGVDLRRTEIACMAFAAQPFCGSAMGGTPSYFFVQAGLPESISFRMSVGGLGIASVGLGGLALILVVVGSISAGAPNSDGANYAQADMMLGWLGVYYLTVGPICYAIISEVSSTRLRNKSVCLSRIAYYIAQIICNVINPYMLNPTAGDWRGKTGFFWGGCAFVYFIWTFFRLPETKDKTFEELILLFARRIKASKFASYKVDAYASGDEVLAKDG
ncbi:alpha-xylosidase [Colletotrichum salicis]|uniref:Alpha-xylosidase n=1 Tax=Colletotrichum salicis TaxID=1209931 RepID=A0A135U8K6_9PEZI|nr:alpha-xylosidase [Colletotrichum salicis]